MPRSVGSASASSARVGSRTSMGSGRGVAATNPSSGGLSVWDAAVSEARRRRADPNQSEGEKAPREATLLVVGTRGAGKTTLLQRFLDREEPPRTTLALEYTYGRKSGKTLVKDVGHLWELGGGLLFTSLLATPITPRSLSQLTVVLMLDLSRPETIWADLERLLATLQEEIQKVVAEAPGLKEQLEEAVAKRRVPDHQDQDKMTPFPVPLVIVGGKYDLFQEMEPEGKKVICRALRFAAHTHGASLQFFSARDPGLIKKAKELLSHFAFGTVESKSVAQDYNKPLIIPAGSDNLGAITGTMDDQHAMTLDAWRHTFTARFPQEHEEKSSVLPEDPGRDPNYREPDVDNLRAQKDEDLERVRREVGRSSARWADLDLS
ncbi:cytoplasmic dynein 2 light intermediate chain 1 isoform X2 [Penaeus vannamei]|uniref:cytoplasmic dynein 2 light intermediate chain 1 isoform X2 n=1 Tax=Penaeus vannamei TaxID=6689 RepID=UPI000F68D194|nr:cytoplasmic dynein 2 light intermediate chain 1-like [Penaeus vannamei]